MVETGDPLAGTERSEASAKNIGMLILTRHSALAGQEKVTHLLSYLTFLSRKILPIAHSSIMPEPRIPSFSPRRRLYEPEATIPTFQLRSEAELSSYHRPLG